MKKIKEEIIKFVTGKSPELLSKVRNELDILEKTEGLEGKNNLEVFYDIWQKNHNKTGNQNQINSWTAYAIGMTNKKPEGEFLPERRAFARAGFPDIDTDFDDEGRDQIYQYLIDKYGRDKVGNVGTHGLLKFRSCIRRVGKVLDLANAYHKGKDAYVTENEAKVTEILSVFSKSSVIKLRDEEGEEFIIKDIDDAVKYSPEFKYYADQYPDFKKYVKATQGIFANFSIHASGSVLSDIPLIEIAPLRTARKTLLATQFPYEDLELLGLIKFDILALSMLTVVKRVLELIKKNYDITLDIDNLPLDDEPTLALFRSGNLLGVFQCESYPMQKTMRDIQVDRFEDIMAAISLFRPGPMDNIPEYAARKKGENKIDYFHPSIEKFVKPYLEKTHSVIIYQEQIMQICHSLAGFSLTDGYVVIKAIGKKKKHLMEKYEKRFIEGCENNKVPKNIAKQYWDKYIVPFAGYGFNLAHAASYSYNSYICCYLKANYPDEFVCATLSVEAERAHYDDKIIPMEKDFAKKLNITFLPRGINDCKIEYMIERKKDIKAGIRKTEIRPSVLCKGLGLLAAKNIVENQPYKNLREFAIKTDTSLVDKKALEALIDNDFFKAKKEKKKIIDQFEKMRRDMKLINKKGIESVDITE